VKAKVCKVCKADFNPMRSMQAVCGPRCAIEHSSLTNRQAREKARRKADRKRKEAIKSRSEWAKEAQAEFNKFIRLRDSQLGCVSCGQSPNQGQRHASHYRSVAAASQLRYDTWNVHASCAQCNSMKSGNVVEYRIRLVDKIGAERVEDIECSNEPRTFDIEYLKRVKGIFSRRARHYKKLRGL
jgi:5-methylcytosine-specific restriction endonuclease McrA